METTTRRSDIFTVDTADWRISGQEIEQAKEEAEEAIRSAIDKLSDEEYKQLLRERRTGEISTITDRIEGVGYAVMESHGFEATGAGCNMSVKRMEPKNYMVFMSFPVIGYDEEGKPHVYRKASELEWIEQDYTFLLDEDGIYVRHVDCEGWDNEESLNLTLAEMDDDDKEEYQDLLDLLKNE